MFWKHTCEVWRGWVRLYLAWSCCIFIYWILNLCHDVYAVRGLFIHTVAFLKSNMLFISFLDWLIYLISFMIFLKFHFCLPFSHFFYTGNAFWMETFCKNILFCWCPDSSSLIFNGRHVGYVMVISLQRQARKT